MSLNPNTIKKKKKKEHIMVHCTWIGDKNIDEEVNVRVHGFLHFGEKNIICNVCVQFDHTIYISGKLN